MKVDYTQKLTRLRTDKNRNRWAETTAFRAPHKPFLILSILDIAAQGELASPFIEPGFDLIERFGRYWSLVMDPGRKCNIAYPFFHMQSEGFWRLVPRPGMDNEIRDRITSSVTRLKRVVLGAEIDEELFLLISGRKTRDELRTAIVHTYFSPEVREKLLLEASENHAAFEYSQKLLKAAEKSMPYGDEKPGRVRDQGFRKAVMTLYAHRCAICGIRMLTPEGHTIVEASHIRPWSESHDDRPANGMALCRLCHWSFDNGFMSVGDDYEIMISPLSRQEQNNPGPIMTFENRPIFKPSEEKHAPDQKCLQWHRRNIFKR
ncbi:MAG: HNH endonuclease [Desulfonatronovibrionaceae bacterium]